MTGLGRRREGGPSTELASLVSGSPAHTYSRVVRFLISSLGPRLQLLGEARGAGGRPPRAWLRETPPQET